MAWPSACLLVVFASRVSGAQNGSPASSLPRMQPTRCSACGSSAHSAGACGWSARAGGREHRDGAPADAAADDRRLQRFARAICAPRQGAFTCSVLFLVLGGSAAFLYGGPPFGARSRTRSLLSDPDSLVIGLAHRRLIPWALLWAPASFGGGARLGPLLPAGRSASEVQGPRERGRRLPGDLGRGLSTPVYSLAFEHSQRGLRRYCH